MTVVGVALTWLKDSHHVGMRPLVALVGVLHERSFIPPQKRA